MDLGKLETIPGPICDALHNICIQMRRHPTFEFLADLQVTGHQHRQGIRITPALQS